MFFLLEKLILRLTELFCNFFRKRVNKDDIDSTFYSLATISEVIFLSLSFILNCRTVFFVTVIIDIKDEASETTVPILNRLLPFMYHYSLKL